MFNNQVNILKYMIEMKCKVVLVLLGLRGGSPQMGKSWQSRERKIAHRSPDGPRYHLKLYEYK